MRTGPVTVAITLAGLLVIGGCGNGSAYDPPASAPSDSPSASASESDQPAGLDAEGAAAWRRWRSQAVDDYRFTLDVGCFCPTVQGSVVEVRNGEVVRIDGKPYDHQQVTGFGESAPTIPGLFTELGDALAHADEVQVDYDPSTGVPETISVDWMKQAVDDEISYRVSGFAPLGSSETG
jgi:hypothetical protein